MKLDVGTSQSVDTGYGLMSVKLVEAMKARGVEMGKCPGRDEIGSNASANALWMGAPSHIHGWWKGQHTHSLTMWEATGIPPGFRENVHEIDTIIVPSEQNRELFSRFHDNVKKVNLGVDPTQWNYRERPPVESEFRFLCAGQGPRKGIDVVVKAFTTVFGNFRPSANEPIPTLTVKDRVGQRNVRGERVKEITGVIPPADEIELYAQAHCFLGMSRGEGFGLMPFQAMAQGCPTILHDAHGHHEFAYLSSAAIGTSLVKADAFIFGDADQWWEPEFDELCEAMWDLYVNYDEYLPVAKHAAEVIADEYTWDHSARKLIDAMGGEDVLNEPDLTTLEWYEPTKQLFHIVSSRDCQYEVNGTVYTFRKGEDYWEFGDLKRMMFENDNLDPVCLGDIHETGLTPAQMTELERYKARHARCHACGQRLNTDMTMDFDDDDALDLIP